MPELHLGEWYLFLMTTAAGCGVGVHWPVAQIGSVPMGTEQSPALLGATAVQESLAVGPGLGGMFAQAHSFSIVIRCKLSPLSREVEWKR